MKRQLRVEYHPASETEVWIPRGRPKEEERPAVEARRPRLEEEISSSSSAAAARGPYAGEALPHSWVPPIHKLEEPHRTTDAAVEDEEETSRSLPEAPPPYGQHEGHRRML